MRISLSITDMRMTSYGYVKLMTLANVGVSRIKISGFSLTGPPAHSKRKHLLLNDRALYVGLAQIVSHPNLYDDQRVRSLVGDLMPVAYGDVRGMALQ